MQTLQPPARPRSNGRAPSIATPTSRRRRFPVAIVAGLVAVGCALLFSMLYRLAGERELVLVMRRSVPAGRVITSDDVTERRVSADAGAHVLAATHRSEVVGSSAAVDLVAGGLLAEEQLGPRRSVGSDEAVVSLSLPDGETPPLGAGDRVEVVRTVPTGAQGDVSGDVVAEGRVLQVNASSQGTGRVSVALVVDRRLAAAIAGAGAAERVRLVRVSGA